MPIPRFPKRRAAKEVAVSMGDPRLDGWESVSTFEDQKTAVAWRDQLRSMGIDAHCVADHPLDRFGRPAHAGRPLAALARGFMML